MMQTNNTSLNTDKVAYHVYETTDYDSFRFIDSNRQVKKTHINSLKTQIEEGYEMPPLIVRSNGDILDGQHRFEALKELKQPIQFIIKESIQKDVLQKSNSTVSKWSVMDHINYHAKEGNEAYQKLKEFMEYSQLSPRSAVNLLGGVKQFRSPVQGIIHGTFYITSEVSAYDFVDEVLIKIRRKPTYKMLSAMQTVYNAGADTKTLTTVVNALHEELELVNKQSKIVERIVSTYNKQCDKRDKLKVSYNKAGKIVLS